MHRISRSLSLCCQTQWPSYTRAPAGKTVNKLFTRPLEWLKGHVCCCLWRRENPYALLQNQTSWAPCDHVSPAVSICSGCGKGVETWSDGLGHCRAARGSLVDQRPLPIAAIDRPLQELEKRLDITRSAVTPSWHVGVIDTMEGGWLSYQN